MPAGIVISPVLHSTSDGAGAEGPYRHSHYVDQVLRPEDRFNVLRQRVASPVVRYGYAGRADAVNRWLRPSRTKRASGRSRNNPNSVSSS